METKYYKDMNHNYLILKCQGEPPGDRYQCKMITENRIPGLLGCSIRYINGEAYLYYEINSMQDIKSLYEYKAMNKVQAICILEELKNVLREMQSFLLPDSGLLLRPEYIYVNCEVEEVRFVYYPYQKGGNENFVLLLFEYFIQIIDHQDKQLVDIIYYLYQLAENDRFVINELEILYNTNIQVETGNKSSGTDLSKKATAGSLSDYESSSTVPPVQVLSDHISPTYVPPLEKRHNIKFLTIAMISATGVAAIIYIKNRYLLGPQEILVTWILLFTFAFILLASGVLYLLLKSSICTEIKVTDGNYQDNGEKENKAANVDESESEDISQKLGDTVFLYYAEETKENKLYGTNNCSKYCIDLNKLPCTVGKMAECVDLCIAEDSISRMHVKFTEKGNHIMMTDLNSTNGTYKNGLRLEPSETVQIETGDEIRLGNLIFSYR